MEKKEIKKSEARILVYLSVVDKHLKYLMKISSKLDMDYGYLIRIIGGMLSKGWLYRVEAISSNKVFYGITERGMLKLEKAKKILTR